MDSEGQRSRVDTNIPRGEDQSYWITYTATDAAGNIGTGLRQVLITCPPDEILCFEDDDSRSSACSVSGRCMDDNLSAALGSADVEGMLPEHSFTTEKVR